MTDSNQRSERVTALLSQPSDDAHMRQLARREMRTRMRALRQVVPEDVVTRRSRALCTLLQAQPFIAEARVIVGYCPIRREIDPMPLLHAALQDHKIVGLPRVSEDGALRVLRYGGETLVPDHFGVLAPDESAEEISAASIDVVLVPALAVDPRGHRLGYGRGFYDRLLSAMPHVHSVALVHPFQRVAELADMPGDVPVSWIATETDVTPSLRT